MLTGLLRAVPPGIQEGQGNGEYSEHIPELLVLMRSAVLDLKKKKLFEVITILVL